MKCYKCSNEIGDGFEYCPICATPIMPNSPAANKAMSIFKDKLFLVICILLSAGAGLAILSGGGLPLIQILGVIFLWITYAKSREGIVNVGSMRSFSGVVYANYIVLNVLAVLLAVLGLLLGGLIALIGTSTELLEAYVESFYLSFNGETINATEAIAIGSGWLVSALLVFAGVILFVLNIFSWKKIHGFAKSFYLNVQTGGETTIINANVTRAWLWVYGIFSAISALGSISNVLVMVANGCGAAAYIIGAILIDKHFISKQNLVMPYVPETVDTPVVEAPVEAPAEQPATAPEETNE